ncbi:methylated-DNA--[protein]-cysteine S-methyltransferase [Ruegeria sp. HKCCA6837]|uniref:methylated-DNA--[protein]-cysteine S-methyltransferase n=1 Tax=Ruegeria sp. HKCCA6837 TaxID=2682989 RepID=UPI001488FF6C|nr:methylated-DNA--[protein]-cysteine S-methyltransferase [Ruegeria sp. HKCCA6837]
MPMIAVETQFGCLGVEETDGALTRLVWDGRDVGEPTDLLREAAAQLKAYDAGQLHRFDIPYRIAGSDFQRQVCDLMYAIPLGETRTYGDIAKELGQPAQPVGQACGANPIPVIIPCHRVLSANGLGGFSGAGGVETKVALLRHERAAGLLI